MGPIKEILAETQFQEELTSSSQTKLVVVDFTATWCGPCQTIAPFYEQLSRKYPSAVFLKVDVDKCQETAVNQRVSVMPTFHFYRNKVKVDSMQGADPQKLEEKIQKYYDDGTAENDVGVAGHVKSSKKPKRTPTKPVKKRESDTKRESKSSNGSKKKVSKNQKKAHGKFKEKRGKDINQEPELELSRIVSSHDGASEGATKERRRSSFKDIAKKVFSKSKNSVDDSEERKRTPSQLTHRSFKAIMSDLFHPHQKTSVVESAEAGSYKEKSKKQTKKKKKGTIEEQ